jgi:predicted dehydrogenase
MVGFNLRWHRLVRRARAIVESGALGEIKAIRGAYTHWHPGEKAQSWHRRRETGGGILFNEGVHHFDLWRYLLGEEVADVYAISRPSAHFEDETSTIVARLTNGVSASCLLSYESSPNNELEIFGRQGRLHISLYRFDGLVFYPNTTYPGTVGSRLQRLAAAAGELPETIPVMIKGGDSDLSYVRQWRHFVDCVRNDREPGCTLLDGKRAVETALAAIESVSTGRPVPMEQGEEGR